MKISSLKLKNLRNEEHFQFQTGFNDLVNQTTPSILGIVNEFAVYTPLFASEGVALDVIIKSAITDELAIADMKRDSTFSGLASAVKSATKHFSTEVKQAAARVQVAFDSYGNVAKKAYDEETAAINSLITGLNSTYAADVTTLGITGWITELTANNDAFDTLKKSRYTEEASKTQLRMKQVRTEVDAAYKAIVERINALIIVNGAGTYAAFVNELNQRIDNFNLVLAQREGRNAKNDKPEGDKPEEPKE